MMRLILGFLIVFLVGCQSEIDKCLDVEMAGWVAQQERLNLKIQENKSNTTPSKDLIDGEMEKKYGHLKPLIFFNKEIEMPDKRSREEVIAEKRYACLKAANNK